MSKKILITGVCGMVGANLVRRLQKLYPGCEILGVDDCSSSTTASIKDCNIHFEKLDICESRFDLVYKSFGPQVVIHLAALFANQNSVDRPELDLKVNGQGTLKVLGLAKENNSNQVIYTSSSCVYGNLKHMVEDNIGNLDTPYAITKMLGEKYCQFYRTHHGLNVTSIRVFNTYGPWDRSGQYRSVIPNFLEQIIEGKSLTIYGDGKDTRSYMYVDDLCEGINSIVGLSKKQAPMLVNLGSQFEASINDLISELEQLTGKRANLVYLPRRDWDSVKYRKPDLRLAKKSLNWQPKITIAQGLSKTFEWFNDTKKN